jgi:hypothetical protein
MTKILVYACARKIFREYPVYSLFSLLAKMKTPAECLRGQIITSNEINNVYEYFNFNFPSFVKGSNILQLTGDFTMTIVNEFPMYTGA